MAAFKSLSVRSGQRKAEEFEGPFEGVPAWMSESLDAWTQSCILEKDFHGYIRVDKDIVLQVEREIRRRLSSHDDAERMVAVLKTDSVLWLDVADALCHIKANRAEALERILQEAGSVWRVDFGTRRLERRVDEALERIAKAEMSQSSLAASFLREAWSALYGRNPDPGGTVSKTIKAVEAVAHPVISPDDAKATLGKMIGALRDKREKWSAQALTTDRINGVELVLTMMETLWSGQTDRHGSGNPAPITDERAASSMEVGVCLTKWFRTGIIQRVQC